MYYILLFFSLIFAMFAHTQSVLSISADKVVFDRKQQTSTYTGNVMLSGNKMTIRANKVQSQRTQQGDKITAIGSDKKPAVYENSVDKIQIFAGKINYRQHTQTLVFSDKVVAITADARLEGDSLVYHLKTKQITGHSQQGGRVSSIIELN